jgi:hypothetical protein
MLYLHYYLMDVNLRALSRRRIAFIVAILTLWLGLLWHGSAAAQNNINLERIRTLNTSEQAATAAMAIRQAVVTSFKNF